jgi:hypothetical protein
MRQSPWILVVLGLIYIGASLSLALCTNEPEVAPAWDMGGRPFVPASAMAADGYHVPGSEAAIEPQYPPPEPTPASPADAAAGGEEAAR